MQNTIQWHLIGFYSLRKSQGIHTSEITLPPPCELRYKECHKKRLKSKYKAKKSLECIEIKNATFIAPYSALKYKEINSKNTRDRKPPQVQLLSAPIAVTLIRALSMQFHFAGNLFSWWTLR